MGWGGVGWGWDDDVPCNMYTSLMLRLCVCRATEIMVGWGGVGWGWDDDVPCNMYTSLMPRLCVSCYGDHGGVGWGGDGMMTFLATCTHL